MEIEARPPLAEAEREALIAALVRAGVVVDPPAFTTVSASAWGRAALEEFVEDDAAETGYTRSPRSTLGATRA